MPIGRLAGPGRASWALAAGWLAYVALVGFGLSCHEPWRDEWQAWMIARESGSLAGLLANARFEPDPSLWFVVLFLASRVTASPVALQLVNLAMASAAAGLVLLRAPFTPWQRLLVPFGYFFLFEYGVISRPYAAVAASLLVWAALVRRRPFVAAVALLAASQLSMYAVPLVVALGALSGAVWVRDARPEVRRAMWPSLALVALGIGLAAWHSRMPPGFAFPREPAATAGSRLLVALSALTAPFLPLPRPELHFWNTSVVPAVLRPLAGPLLLGLTAWSLRADRAALRAYLAGSGLFVAVMWLVSGGGVRHHGLLFVFYLSLAWFAKDVRRESAAGSSRVMSALLILSCVGSAVAFPVDVRHAFSASGGVASYLRGRGLENAFIAGLPDHLASPLAGLLGRPLWYVNGSRPGTFVVWDTARLTADMPAFSRAASEAARRGAPVVLVTQSPVRESPGLRLVFRSGPAIVANESYFVYELDAPR